MSNLVKGIDVSHFQGRIDWRKVAASGVKFAFLKATQGTHYIDPTFVVNRTAAQNAGVLVGAYHFFTPTQDATAQAKHFVAHMGKLNGQLPPVLDIEDGGDLTIDEYRASVKKWVEVVKRLTAVTPIIYASPSYLTKYKLTELLPECPLWVAHYTKKTPASNWTFWQYTSSGKVDGITGNVDMNWFRGKAEEVQLKEMVV